MPTSDAAVEEFLKDIPDDPKPAVGVGAVTVPVAPLTGAALDATIQAANERGRVAAVNALGRTEFEKKVLPMDVERQGLREGIPLDTESGIPALARLRVELQRNKESQIKVLQGIYGESNVRKNPKGGLVITQIDPATGKPQDVLVDPEGPDVGDWLKAAVQIPEMLGALLVTKGVSPATLKGVMPVLKFVGKMALGQEAAGALKDVGARAAEGLPIDLPEIAKERGEMAAVDMTLGTLGAAGAKAVGIGASPLGNRAVKTQIQEAAQARADLVSKFGLPPDALPQTIGQSTGNVLFQRLESMGRKMPGSSTAFESLMQRQNAELNSVTRAIEGANPPLPEEVLGQRLAGALGEYGEGYERRIATLGSEIGQTAQAEIESGVTRATGVLNPVSKVQLGKDIREAAMAKRKAYEALGQQEYGEVYKQLPEGVKNIGGEPLAKDAAELLNKLPTNIKTAEVETGLLDEFGAPLKSEKETKKVLTEFVPANVLGKLRQLVDSEGEFTLKELTAMRNEVANDIAVGEATPGYQTRYLGKIRDMLTNRIRGGLEEIDPSGGLLKTWETANNNYAKRAQELNRAGIAELFKTTEAGTGYLGDTAVVERALSGRGADDIYNAYKGFFGESHPAVKQLKRAVADEVVGTNPLDPMVDAKGFVRRLEGLYRDAPELADEVFGKEARKLRSSALAMKEGTLNAEELADVMRSGNLSATKLNEMMAAERTRETIYKNSILKETREGVFGTGTRINPNEFVERFAFKASPPEVRSALGVLSETQPDLIPEIRQYAVSKVFAEARDKSGELTASGLESALKSQSQRERLESIAGADTVKDIENLAKFLKPGELADDLLGSVGSFGATGRLTRVIEHSDLGYAKLYVKNRLLGMIYTSKPLREWLSRGPVSDEAIGKLLKAAVMTEPVVRAVGLPNAGSASDSITTQEASKSQGGLTDADVDQFLGKP